MEKIQWKKFNGKNFNGKIHIENDELEQLDFQASLLT